MTQGNFVYLTKERLVEIEKELKEMKMNGRKEMAAKIAEARAHGDLSENAEYDAAKEEQGLFELKISKIEDKAKQKYLTNNSKKEYRYRDDTKIKEDELIDGNVVVVKGNLSVHGEVKGDILVLYGDIRVKNDAFIKIYNMVPKKSY